MPPIRSGSTLRDACTVRPDRCLDVGDDALEVGVGELAGGGQLDVEDARLHGDERLELLGDAADLAGAALLDDEQR